ncbi:TPM domain-containing protein [Paenibacillus sp. JCM 10914]|uniref:TPM domain-containing protein n=1 Tax=Paenibacillus sp. JCM 10914 TaxID=1236974 RepID=UPI0005631C37|nr:TPM domain-containing protein [Paenibacillus sp. JCM 10914]
MKFIRMIMVVLVLTMISGISAYAAGIPNKEGYVQDKAGLFDQGQIKYLNKIAEGEFLNVYILTLPRLNGANPTDIANQTYAQWKLKNQDTLLLISLEDRSVEFNFNRPDLQKVLDDWSHHKGLGSGSVAITALLDTYFIPFAREGDFSKASASMINQVHRLGSVAAQATTSSEHEIMNPEPAPELETSSKFEPTMVNTNGLNQLLIRVPWLQIFVASAIIIFIGSVLLGWFKLRRLTRIQLQFAELTVRCNTAQEKVTNFREIVKGTTAEAVQEIYRVLTEQCAQAVDSKQELKKMNVFIFDYKNLNLNIHRYSSIRERIDHTVMNEESKLMVIEVAGQTSKDMAVKLNEELQMSRKRLDRKSTQTGFPLQKLYEELQQIESQMQRAIELNLFDPLESQRVLRIAEQRRAIIGQNIDEVDVFLQDHLAFQEKLEATHTEIRQIIESNHLNQIKVRPFERLEESRYEMKQSESYLRAGAMDEVRRHAERAHTQRAEALSLTQFQADLRSRNQTDLPDLKDQVQRFYEEHLLLNGILDSCRDRFKSRYWSTGEHELIRTQSMVTGINQNIADAERLTDDLIQDFEAARTRIDEGLSMMSKVRLALAQVRTELDKLDERLQRVRNDLASSEDVIIQHEETVSRSQIVTRSHMQVIDMPQFIWESIRTLYDRLSSTPYDLEHLELMAALISKNAEQFSFAVREIVRQKEEAERRIAQVERQYKQVARKAGRSFKKTSKSYLARVRDMLSEGLYTEAIYELQQIDDYMRRVASDIQQQEIIEQQRRAAIETQRTAVAMKRAADQISKSSRSGISSSFSQSNRSSNPSHSGVSPDSSSSKGSSTGKSSWSGNSNSNNSSGGSKW